MSQLSNNCLKRTISSYNKSPLFPSSAFTVQGPSSWASQFEQTCLSHFEGIPPFSGLFLTSVHEIKDDGCTAHTVLLAYALGFTKKDNFLHIFLHIWYSPTLPFTASYICKRYKAKNLLLSSINCSSDNSMQSTFLRRL